MVIVRKKIWAYLFLLLAGLANGQTFKCKNLANMHWGERAVVRADFVPAGDFKAPDGQTYAVPAFCRAWGIARPGEGSRIKFEAWLPVDPWNGRFHQIANGGLSGYIDYSLLAAGIVQGYAVANTDDGHASDGGTQTVWALKQPDRILDFGYRALKTTAELSKAIIQKFYGRPPRYSYLSGCSRGGAQAMMGAQRFAHYWDGILAGSPVVSWTGMQLQFISNMQPQVHDPAARLLPAKLPAIQKTALAACGVEAQVVDGIAADPRFCRFDPATLLCEGAETDDCLTAPQVATLKRIYNGPRDAQTGAPLYVGFEPTMENEVGPAGGWRTWITGIDPANTVEYQASSNFYRTMVFDDLAWDYQSFDLRNDVHKTRYKPILGKPLTSVIDPASTDLRALRDGGGKLLMYFGWGDEALSPQSAVDYFERVAKEMGGARIQDFYRLFMAPGMMHCGGGPGPNAFGQFLMDAWQAPGNVVFQATPLRDDRQHDVLRALEAWVEKDIAPERIIAAKYKEDNPKKGVEMTRPLCSYPKIPVYKGQGSAKVAENFYCKNVSQR